MMIDGAGITGLILDYTVIFSFSLGAAVLFIYFWRKGKLDFDEAPKHEMLEEESTDDP